MHRFFSILVVFGVAVAGSSFGSGPLDNDDIILRGDVDGNGLLDMADSIGILNSLFLGSSLKCPNAADVNGDGRKDLSDSVYLNNYLFLGGPPPAEPRTVTCGA